VIAHIHSTLPLHQFLRRESYPTQERRVTSVSPIPRDCIVMMRRNPRSPSLAHVSPFRLLLIHSSPNRASLNITLLSQGIVLHQHKQHLHNPREFTQTTHYQIHNPSPHKTDAHSQNDYEKHSPPLLNNSNAARSISSQRSPTTLLSPPSNPPKPRKSLSIL
jgi:hypothetical protein